MTRILIPRSDNISAKPINPSDFEKYFECHLPDHIVCGLALSAGAGLTVNIASGHARFKGFYLENTATCSVSSLTASSTNKIYMQICRDVCSEGDEYTFGFTTGAIGACQFHIGNAITNGSTVTSTTIEALKAGDGKLAPYMRGTCAVMAALDYFPADILYLNDCDGALYRNVHVSAPSSVDMKPINREIATFTNPCTSYTFVTGVCGTELVYLTLDVTPATDGGYMRVDINGTPNLTFNPTACDPQSISRVFSVTCSLSVTFTAIDCPTGTIAPACADQIDLSLIVCCIADTIMKPDGTKMWVLGDQGSQEKVHQYSLCPPFCVSCATKDTCDTLCIQAQVCSARSITASPDGTNLYVVCLIADVLYRYTGCAWDLSTFTYASQSFTMASTPSPISVRTAHDGVNFFVWCSTNDRVWKYRYNTCTPWSLSGAASVSGVATWCACTTITAGNLAGFSNCGGYIWLYDCSDDKLKRFTLGTAYCLSSRCNTSLKSPAITASAAIAWVPFEGTRVVTSERTQEIIRHYEFRAGPTAYAIRP
jgi:hypothetical protein